MKKLILIFTVILTCQFLLIGQKCFKLGENQTALHDTISKTITGTVEIDRHIYDAGELKLKVKYTLDSTIISDKDGNEYETSKCSKKDCKILHLKKDDTLTSYLRVDGNWIQLDTITPSYPRSGWDNYGNIKLY